MVLVNEPAVGPPYLYRQLTHAPWNGWTFADTIFPTFLFVVGVAMAFSRRRHHPGRIVRRAVVLFAVGLVLNAAPSVLSGVAPGSVAAHLRVMGVLQRIAVCDLVASLAALLLDTAGQLLVAVALLLGYWALLAWVPVPHHPAGLMTPAVSLPGWIDRVVLGTGHMYAAGHGGYDPEGLLGCLPATAGVLIGLQVGRLLRRTDRTFAVATMVVAGVAMVGVGVAWSHAFPVNKRMWTSSYVVLMSGMATLALAFAHAVLDRQALVARVAAWPVRVLGANALVVYAGTELTGSAFGAVHHRMAGLPRAPFTYWVWHRWLDPALGPWHGNLAWAAGVALVWAAVAVVLWKRRLLVRI
jgi:predicted acyltransferase